MTWRSYDITARVHMDHTVERQEGMTMMKEAPAWEGCTEEGRTVGQRFRKGRWRSNAFQGRVGGSRRPC